MRTPYGYTRHVPGTITINQEQAKTVNLIYDLYLRGKSLGRIANTLKERGISSPTGKPVWGRAAIDKLLSNSKYVPLIISGERFWEAQIEKERRSNLELDNKTRKTARYNSQHVLSGLLICGDCGKNYRRITRPSGEVVWQCADKVENGKRAACANAVTVSDAEVQKLICEHLEVERFDEEAVQDAIEAVKIGERGILFQMKSTLSFSVISF